MFNLDNDGRSEFQYPGAVNEQYSYNMNNNGSEPQEHGNGNYRVPTTNTSNNNYNPVIIYNALFIIFQ